MGHRLGFGRHIAHETTIARFSINRLRLALLGIADRELDAGAASLPTSFALEGQLEREIDRETQWFEEDLALFGKMRHAIESRFAMEQELNLVIARTPNPVHRPRAKKVSPSEARKDQLDREGFQRRKYIDKQNKLTPLARTIVGKLPLAKGESSAGFEFILFSAMEFAGFEKVADVLSARDIADDTREIRRLLRVREDGLAAVYLAETMARHRDRITASASGGKGPAELCPLVRPLFAEGVVDPKPILAATLARYLKTIDAINCRIEGIRARRTRTIESVIKRRGGRLQLSITQARGYRSRSKAEWTLEGAQR